MDVTNALALRFESSRPGRFAYLLPGPNDSSKALWEISCEETRFRLVSEFAGTGDLPPLALAFDQKASHPTLLGLMESGARRMSLPCVLHLPDKGSLRISCNVAGHSIGYDARRYVRTPFVRVEFPPATADHPHLEYTLEIVGIYPNLPRIEGDARFDGFRRGFLNNR